MSQYMQCPNCKGYKVTDGQGFGKSQRMGIGFFVGIFLVIMIVFTVSQGGGGGIAGSFIWVLLLLALLAWVFNPPAEYSCYNCGYRWKSK